MAAPQTLFVGDTPWSLVVPDERQVVLRRAAIAPPIATPSQLARAALETPHGFEPMRRAVTPDDRVAVVIDPTLPQLGTILNEVLAHLNSAGVPLEAVTVLTPAGSTDGWAAQLPAESRGVRTQVHDPADRKRLAYLASTSTERRLYLNRTLVDADFVVVLTARGYDPVTGYAGAEAALYPALGDDELRTATAGQLSIRLPDQESWPVRGEALEAVRWLGTPFFVQVIPGEGDAVHDIVGGLTDSLGEGIRRLDARWRGAVGDAPDTAIASIAGDPSRVTFLDLAKAAACAARVVGKGGRIAVLTTAAPELNDGARLLSGMDGPGGARKRLERLKPPDWPGAFLWAFAAKNHSLFLASGYPDDVAEGLFATTIHTPAEVQRLVDSGSKVLLIPDAHKTMIEVRDA